MALISSPTAALTSHVTAAVVGRVPGLATVLTAPIDIAVQGRYHSVRRRVARLQARHPDDSPEDLSERLAMRTTTLLGAVGVAAGGVAAIPTVGTGAAIVAVSADAAVSLAQVSELVMAIGIAHGFAAETPTERRTWVLASLGLAFDLHGDGDPAVLGPGGAVLTDALPPAAMATISHALVDRIITKMGVRRGVLRLGRLLPFGIGAVAGGVGNVRLVQEVHAASLLYFGPPPGGPVIMGEVLAAEPG